MALLREVSAKELSETKLRIYIITAKQFLNILLRPGV